MVKGFYLVAIVLAAIAAVFALIAAILSQAVGVGEATVEAVSSLLTDAGLEPVATSGAFGAQKAIIAFATWCYTVLGFSAAFCTGIGTLKRKPKRKP